ncbi:MAG: hypothetical protein ACI4FW_12675 [Bariatricus sp.]
MAEKLEMKCKELIARREYKECEKVISEAMERNPHSAVPHNLMGILMENEQNHVFAMKHFRAAYGLDPTYIPARYNMERDGSMYPTGNCAYSEEDLPVRADPQFKMVYDKNHVGHLVRK